MFWFFGREACGILVSQPGIKHEPPALEGEVLTIGPPGKCLAMTFYSHFIQHLSYSSLEMNFYAISSVSLFLLHIPGNFNSNLFFFSFSFFHIAINCLNNKIYFK